MFKLSSCLGRGARFLPELALIHGGSATLVGGIGGSGEGRVNPGSGGGSTPEGNILGGRNQA